MLRDSHVSPLVWRDYENIQARQRIEAHRRVRRLTTEVNGRELSAHGSIAFEMSVRGELLMTTIRQSQDRVELVLGKTKFLGHVALVLDLHCWVIGRLRKLQKRLAPTDLPGADEARQMRLSLVNAEFCREYVPLIEAREHRFVVLASVIPPAVSLLSIAPSQQPCYSRPDPEVRRS